MVSKPSLTLVFSNGFQQSIDGGGLKRTNGRHV